LSFCSRDIVCKSSFIEAAVSKARARQCHKILGATAIQTELFYRFRKDPFTVSFGIGKDSPSRPKKNLKRVPSTGRARVTKG
jgi:hypothetical protein